MHFVCVSVTDWHVLAERLDLTANEIKFVDARCRNPSEALLTFVAQRRDGMNVDDLYDV